DSTLEVDSARTWPTPTEDDVALIQYTSGSTAAPKGVPLTHAGILHNQRMMGAAFDTGGRFVVVGWLPLHHDMGLIGNVLHPLYRGAHCILMAPETFLMRPIRWLEAITEFGATTSGGPNFAYDLCVDRIPEDQRAALNLSSWRVAYNGAEPIRADTLDRFREAFAPCGLRPTALTPCYGLAEATLLVSAAPPDAAATTTAVAAEALTAHIAATTHTDRQRQLVACGAPAPGIEVRIVDEDGRPLDERHVGEIEIRGPSVIDGYWGEPRRNEAWFATGDLGFLQNGDIVVTGRLKDLIIIAGRNLYPQDIERSTSEAHDAVFDRAVVAFSIDAPERLVVVAEAHRRRPPDDEVHRAIKRRISEDNDVVVHDIVLIKQGTLPRTSSGKLRRRACRHAYLQGRLSAQETNA
ncbi:MAG: fatty acyl-AMP ligase, partial [Myxococcota bacterium]